MARSSQAEERACRQMELSDPARSVQSMTVVDLPAPPAPVAATPALGSLSPSRASDFLSCPLKYRFRVVDRLAEPPSPAATRGTLVHAVLERLFDLPPAERTPAAAAALVQPEWERLQAEDDGLAPALFPGEDAAEAVEAWLAGAGPLLDAYFALEDPRRLLPAARELLVSHTTQAGLTLRGIVDRLDEAPAGPHEGALRVVDYKTGRAPSPEFEARVLFQLKFYALVLWRTRGRVPAVLELLYLGGERPERLRYAPDEQDLVGVERTLHALGAAIARAHETGDWRPRASALCGWCAHQSICPTTGGTPPPLPARIAAGEIVDVVPELVDVTG